MSKVLKRIFFGTIYFSGLPAIFRLLNKDKIPILVYHGVYRKPFNAGLNNASYLHIDLKTFIRQMRFLKNKYNVISLEELCDALSKGKDLPNYTAVLTFDDGYLNVFENAYPVLKDYGLPFTVFLVSKTMAEDGWLWLDKIEFIINNTNVGSVHLGGSKFCLKNIQDKKGFLFFIRKKIKALNEPARYKLIEELLDKLNFKPPEVPPTNYRLMSYYQAMQMDAGLVSFGSHTPEHSILTIESPERVSNLLIECRDRIFSHISRQVNLFSYPNGSYNFQIQETLKQLKFMCGLTTVAGLNRKNADLFEMKRISIGSDDTLSSFAVRLSGFNRIAFNFT